MKNFEQFKLSKQMFKSLKNINFDIPTPIQEKSIPLALKGKDILGSAQTGTGKTAAFCIPMIEKLMLSDTSTSLILTPTRELAKQILDSIHILLGFQNHLKSVVLIGGEPISKQLSILKKKPRIIIGTPGRINDLLERKTLNFSKTNYLVLDETDRMLDMGFGPQLDKILKYIPKNKQTLMFSATLPDNIIKLSSKYMIDPERVSIGASNVIAQNINQEIINLKSDSKKEELINQISKREGSILVFVKTKFGSEKLAKFLVKSNIKSFALHGGLRQSKRNNVMKKFRDEKFKILIATDVAARGLDIPHIQHIINFDLPQLPEDFIHRLGRTARAGLKGNAISFITKADKEKWKAIEKVLDPNKKFVSSKNKRNNRDNSARKNIKKRSFKQKNYKSKDRSYVDKKDSYKNNKKFKNKKPRRKISSKRFPKQNNK